MSDLAATKERLAEAMELERLRAEVAELRAEIARRDRDSQIARLLAGQQANISDLARLQMMNASQSAHYSSGLYGAHWMSRGPLGPFNFGF